MLNEFIYTPGQVQTATINVAGAYKKEVDVTPYNLGPNAVAGHFLIDVPLYDANNSDDVIFGGWDDDFLHGGSGDDAIAGGEAIDMSYVQHFAGGLPNGLIRNGQPAAVRRRRRSVERSQAVRPAPRRVLPLRRV